MRHACREVFLTVAICRKLFAVLALSAVAFASAPRDRTQFGHQITVESHEEVSDATCLGCTVRVRGHVVGDVTTFGGSIIVEDQGEISGDSTTFGGNIRLGKGARAKGDVTVFGGRINRDQEATIGGDVANFGGTIWLLLIFGLPLLLFGAFIALIVWLVRRLLRPAIPVAA